MGRTNVPLDPSKTGREALELEANLCKRIVGQQEAIREIVGIYQMYLSGLTAPGRPIGNLLFLGPTGSGKTRTVEATAECLLKNPRAVIKIDCGEFQHSHEIAKLIGSPPGYLGHRETHALLSPEFSGHFNKLEPFLTAHARNRKASVRITRSKISRISPGDGNGTCTGCMPTRGPVSEC